MGASSVRARYEYRNQDDQPPGVPTSGNTQGESKTPGNRATARVEILSHQRLGFDLSFLTYGEPARISLYERTGLFNS